MDVHPRNAAAAAAAMGEMFPHEPAAMESEEHNLEWLSFFVEDCLSTSTNPQSAELAPTIMASQGIAKQNLPPRSSSNARKRKRSLASVISETEDQHYITLFVEPPLLLLDQKQWLAESELILPKKDNDQELLHQPEQEQQEQEQQQEQQQEQEQEQEQQQEQEQEQEQKEEKYKMSAITQFQQERHVRKCSLVRKCSRCLSTQTPQWRDGPSGSLCNACGLKIKAKRFTTVSESHYDQEIDKEQDTGKRSRKKKRHYDQEIDEEQDTEKRPQKKKAVYVNEEMPAEEPVKRCTHCMSYKTPQWRTGPLGPKSLCNACGMRFKSGRLLPEYRPANSPTYVSNVHSNSHRKVIQLRQSFAHPWE